MKGALLGINVVGSDDGVEIKVIVGASVGEKVGSSVGITLGISDGVQVVGEFVGEYVTPATEGAIVLGVSEGESVGS
jgi:hypothetical protein